MNKDTVEIYDSNVFEAVKTKQGILIRKPKKQKPLTANNPHDSVLDYVDDARIKSKEKKK